MRMLFFDDDPFARAAFVRSFEQYGRNGEAENGKQAVAAFKSAHEAGDPFHLVFMDISMPVMDGHEALRRMRRIEGEMGIRGKNRFKAVMASALDDRRNLGESFLEDGAEMYVTKPVNFPSWSRPLKKRAFLGGRKPEKRLFLKRRKARSSCADLHSCSFRPGARFRLLAEGLQIAAVP